MSKRQGMQTFRRETDRFWVLAVHPTQNLLGAGHDAGLIVFKLERERPAYVPLGESLLFIKDRSVRAHDYTTGKDALLLSIRRAAPLRCTRNTSDMLCKQTCRTTFDGPNACISVN